MNFRLKKLFIALIILNKLNSMNSLKPIAKSLFLGAGLFSTAKAVDNLERTGYFDNLDR